MQRAPARSEQPVFVSARAPVLRSALEPAAVRGFRQAAAEAVRRHQPGPKARFALAAELQQGVLALASAQRAVLVRVASAQHSSRLAKAATRSTDSAGHKLETSHQAIDEEHDK